jgi:hypothetical protein
MKSPQLRVLQSLAILFGLATSCSSWALFEGAKNLSKTDGACWVFAKTPAVVWYDTIDERNPRAPAKSQPNSEPDDGVNDAPPDYHLDSKECGAFTAAKADGLFNISQRRSWYRKSDFITADKLERVDRWTTRYIFRRTALSGAGAELGVNPNMLSLGEEIAAYRASTIRQGLFMFTPEAHWIDTERNVRWEIRRTPTGRLALVDPSGEYLTVVKPVFNRAYQPKCETDSQDKLVCGLVWRNQICEGRKELNRPNDGYGDDCSREAQQNKEVTYGRLIRMYGRPESHHPGIEFGPERVVISRRYVLSRRDPNQHYLDFYARFDDPIRPVFFAPGTLFSAKATPHAGKPKPGELIMKSVCLADCPDQLLLQGLVK